MKERKRIKAVFLLLPPIFVTWLYQTQFTSHLMRSRDFPLGVHLVYTARHSFAMTMQNLDKPVEIISQALGHQSVETTKHYLAKFSSTKMAKETDIDLPY